ncbi:glycosyltransferase family 39 protein [Mucilaginibacter sp. BJC16-A38]|uniref:ArnT family glycosyltransferase n=1 Tax=Mucilaginibacter phenanthrenivorans TaxID=1234842 RepID=UPI00215790F9|nr:glycosyltransferase family 39 protein [Mucilaginibacter phenanthrenivorans]MCR8561022.1 glycosyltransferase family 39 protein [Mucilaginibacter phenanthrenivorans]
MKEPNKIIFLAFFILALAVNFAGINVKFFTDDPGLYAAISKNLIYKKSFLELFTYNRDWLDKPHFPFWLVLFSFKAFGISECTYRLPALLFFALSLLYTWLFAVKYYSREIAFTAVLIVMTALHVLLSNTDVRAEPYLMGLLMGSIYHVACLQQRYSFKHLFLAAMLTACAIMTKGIFVIIPVGGALFGQLAFQKRLADLFSFKWLALIVVTIIFTIPELYALYIQFDLHPEKIVFGTNHVSGLKWFLWDSQFGRFINAGPISRAATGSKFFYLHTLLWAFAPWCLLFYYAVFKSVKNIFKGVRLTEYYTLSGGLLLLLLFSFSGFQLPFYTNAVFPLFAIVTAPFCVNQLSRFGTNLRAISLWIFAIALPLVVVALNYLLKPASNVFFVTDIIIFGIMIVLILKSVKENYKRIFFACCAAALFAGFYLNTVFYNEIVPYRGEIAAAEYINQKPFDNFKIYSLKFENNIFQFYSKKPIDYLPIEEFKNFRPQQTSLFYVSQRSMDYLVQTHAAFTIVHSFIDYPQENLKPNFLNRATRATVLGKVYLISKP